MAPLEEQKEGEKSHSEQMDEAGTPTLKSLITYFLPLSPMNPSTPMWLVSLVPAALYFTLAPPGPYARYLLLGSACGDATLDSRPAWLQALDCGERVVLTVIHFFIASFHLQIGSYMKSEYGAKTFAEARELAFTDAPKGTCAHDALQWPPGQYIQRPVWYMRFHTLIDCLPLYFFATGQPDLAFMAMVVEKAGGLVDHLFMYGGTFKERAKTLYPIMIAICLRFCLLMLNRAQPAHYGIPTNRTLDAAAHVAAAAFVGAALRPIGWLVCGARPASRGRPGRRQTPYKKAS